ncbi:hypothetical protein HPP92_024014 [Vanilla planifolia]|uniref:Uncharacterized protein n=1 Tax=Vanilla planifolia TaxID=51239 RepID=A0A835PR80_VANPL|nr:hypothetical protein HPP92_024014 [Vanilla planifolia]
MMVQSLRAGEVYLRRRHALSAVNGGSHDEHASVNGRLLPREGRAGGTEDGSFPKRGAEDTRGRPDGGARAIPHRVKSHRVRLACGLGSSTRAGLPPLPVTAG